VRAARAVGLPVFASFVCGDAGRLLSGESLAAAVDAVAALGPEAILVNCLPAAWVGACLPFVAGCGLPFGVYANAGAETEPLDFADAAAAWVAAGARVVGVCCGVRPAHLRAVAQRLARRG
jgi:homocysteine S-methyltransferase